MDDRNDIKTMEDIELLVNTFYEKVRIDLLLGGIFNGVIKDRWPQHLEKMYRFWQTVLFGQHAYKGSPFLPHARLPIEQKHFDAWLRLWNETIDSFFNGENAERAKWQGDKMALMFLSKIEYYRNNPAIPLL